LLADALIPKALGNDEEASRLYEVLKSEIGKQEIYFQTCYDHTLLFYSLERIFKSRTKTPDIIY
jgi:sugar (pentulose or hexulose) kinase